MSSLVVKSKITFVWTMILFCLPLLIVGSALAIARGFVSTDNGLQKGMAVSVVQANSSANTKIERASQDKQEDIIGVATSSSDNLLTIAIKEQQIFVQTEGEVEAYATDLNGPINKGDRLVISPLKGIMMSSHKTDLSIIAIATDDFASAKEREVKKVQTPDGERDVNIGKIKISLDNRTSNTTADNTSLLSKFGKAVTGKQVGNVRVMIAMVLFIIVLVVEGVIIYGAISSAITALGRNPMAKKLIRQETMKVITIAIVVLLIGLAAVYLLLWL